MEASVGTGRYFREDMIASEAVSCLLCKRRYETMKRVRVCRVDLAVKLMSSAGNRSVLVGNLYQQ